MSEELKRGAVTRGNQIEMEQAQVTPFVKVVLTCNIGDVGQ